MAGEGHFKNNETLKVFLNNSKYILLKHIDSEKIIARDLARIPDLTRDNIPLSKTSEILRREGKID